jgi:hypothetical protein
LLPLKFLNHLPFRFKTFGSRYSSIELEYQAAIGNLKNKENHQFQFQVLDHYYQEVGLSGTVSWEEGLG